MLITPERGAEPTLPVRTGRPGKGSPRIVYIAGFRGSGAKMLGAMLGNHEYMFGSGEITHVFDAWNHNHLCTCLKRFRDCEFWNNIFARVKADAPDLSLEEAARATRIVDRALDPHRAMSNARAYIEQVYRLAWRTLFRAVRDQWDASVIVDASMSTRRSARRVWALASVCGLRVDVVHLVRDPRAVMWSALRACERDANSHEHGAGRALLRWYGANMGVQGLTRLRHLHAVRVRYEDLASQPGGEIQRIADALELDLGDVVDRLESGAPWVCRHAVARTPARHTGIRCVGRDDDWHVNLPTRARAMAWLSWPLARSYGYRVTR